MSEGIKVKIIFTSEDNDVETMWSQKLISGGYRIENSPFFIYGISFEDVVSVKKNEADQLEFEKVISYSGNSTYRIFSDRKIDDNDLSKMWTKLEKIGCTYESMKSEKTFLAVNVPKETNVSDVYKILEDGESDGIWEFEEGHFSKNNYSFSKK